MRYAQKRLFSIAPKHFLIFVDRASTSILILHSALGDELVWRSKLDKKFNYKPSAHRDEIRRIMRRAILTRSSIKNCDLNRTDVLSDLHAIRETLEIFSSAPKKAGRNTMSWLANQLEEACERLAVIQADAKCPSDE